MLLLLQLKYVKQFKKLCFIKSFKNSRKGDVPLGNSENFEKSQVILLEAFKFQQNFTT